MEIVTFAALVALATKLVTFIKQALNRDKGAVTQAASWVVGVIVAFLAAHAGLTQRLVIPGTEDTFGQLDAWSTVLVGLALGSAGSLTYDAVGSRTWEPPLLGFRDRAKNTELAVAEPKPDVYTATATESGHDPLDELDH